MHTNAQATAGIVGSFYQCWASHLIWDHSVFPSLCFPMNCHFTMEMRPHCKGKAIQGTRWKGASREKGKPHYGNQQHLHSAFSAQRHAAIPISAVEPACYIFSHTTGTDHHRCCCKQSQHHYRWDCTSGSAHFCRHSGRQHPAGPAICKAEAGKSTRDLCKRFPALMSHKHLRKALPAPPDTEFWCLSALPLY